MNASIRWGQFIAIAILLLPATGAAQSTGGLRRGFVRTDLTTEPVIVGFRSPALPESRTFWKEGGIVGGSITAIVGLLFLLDKDENGAGGAPFYAVPPLAGLSFLVGFGPGALIGGLFPKPESPESP